MNRLGVGSELIGCCAFWHVLKVQQCGVLGSITGSPSTMNGRDISSSTASQHACFFLSLVLHLNSGLKFPLYSYFHFFMQHDVHCLKRKGPLV